MNDIPLEEKLKKINNEIKKHNDLYYNKSSSIISDAKYDKLCKIRDKLEKKLSINDLTIGSLPDSGRFAKISHISPMLSLNNGFITKDIENFITKIKRFLNFPEKNLIDFYCEEKIDGVSISLIYINNKLTHALTRGNGYIGEDILCNVAHMFPKYLNETKKKITEIEIRGEIYINHNELEKINENNNNKFLNTRNAASGSIRHLDCNIAKQRNLRYFMYAIGSHTNITFNSQSEIIQILKKWGFIVNENYLKTNKIDEIFQWYNKTHTQRAQLKYDIDGVVYKVNNTELQRRLGHANRYPRWAIAHKFPAQQAETIIKDIKIQVSRTGILTPVAELEPIELSGAIIQRASLHNKDDIIRKNIYINDTATIIRAGEIIPQILYVHLNKRNANSKPFKFPDYCPSCGTKVIHNIKNVAIKCPNELQCPAQIIGKLIHFTSREAFNINGLGKKQIEYLFNVKLIKDIPSIFTLQIKNLINLPNWGEKSAKNLIYEIKKKHIVTLDCFIYSLGIKFIGINTAKILAQHLKNYQNFRLLFNYNINSILNNINGIGSKTIESLKSFTSIKENIIQIDKLANILTILNNETKKIKSEINNKIIVFTGTLKNMSRAEAKSIAEKFGAKVVNNITKDTNYLISNAVNTTKIKKAMQFNIKIITEEEWLNIAKNNFLLK